MRVSEIYIERTERDEWGKLRQQKRKYIVSQAMQLVGNSNIRCNNIIRAPYNFFFLRVYFYFRNIKSYFRKTLKIVELSI